jgi:hypothetical protein
MKKKREVPLLINIGIENSPSRTKTILQVYLIYNQRNWQPSMSISESVLLKIVTVFTKLFDLEYEAYFCFSKFLNYSTMKEMV